MTTLQTVNAACVWFGVACLCVAVASVLWALGERDRRVRAERENRSLRKLAPWGRVWRSN